MKGRESMRERIGTLTETERDEIAVMLDRLSQTVAAAETLAAEILDRLGLSWDNTTEPAPTTADPTTADPLYPVRKFNAER